MTVFDPKLYHDQREEGDKIAHGFEAIADVTTLDSSKPSIWCEPLLDQNILKVNSSKRELLGSISEEFGRLENPYALARKKAKATQGAPGTSSDPAAAKELPEPLTYRTEIRESQGFYALEIQEAMHLDAVQHFAGAVHAAYAKVKPAIRVEPTSRLTPTQKSIGAQPEPVEIRGGVGKG